MINELEQKSGDAEPVMARSRRGKVVAAVVFATLVAVAAAVFVFLPGGEAGRPVPPPPTVRFDGVDGGSLTGGEKLVLQPVQVANAGIKTEQVEEVALDSAGTINGTGVLSADAYADIPVTAAVAGSLSEVFVELGSEVDKGTRLAAVVSDEFARAESDYLVAALAFENAKRNWDRRKTLLGVNQPGRSEYESALREHLSAAALLAESTARFERSKRLVEIGATSREKHDEETARFKGAEAEAARAKARLTRAETVLGVSAEVLGEEEQAREGLTKAAGDQVASKARLKMFGLTEGDVEELRRRNAPSGVLTMRAQSSGVVTVRSGNPGQLVQKDQELFRVTDLRKLWFIAQAFEQDARSISVGASAEVTVGGEASPRRGRVVYIDSKVNEATRTVQVRIELSNSDRALRIGTVATASFSSSEAGGRTLAVKRSAVQRLGREDVVFIALEDGTTFEVRPVRLGGESGGLVQVLEGLKKGERVVVDGSFLLRAEWLKRNPS